MLNRRGFLTAAMSAAGAFALDPERALWMPGKRLISVPDFRYIPGRLGSMVRLSAEKKISVSDRIPFPYLHSLPNALLEVGILYDEIRNLGCGIERVTHISGPLLQRLLPR